jgi:hypothetical protein
MVDYEKEGQYQTERIALEERQKKENEQAEKFIRLHELKGKEAEDHREDVAKEHKNQIKQLNEEYGKKEDD